MFNEGEDLDAEKKAAAEQKAKDDMMKERTTGWNTNADEDNTNFQKAGDLIKKYSDYLRQAEAISPAPQSMLKNRGIIMEKLLNSRV